MRITSGRLLLLSLFLVAPVAAQPLERCVAGELVLPFVEGWVTEPTPDIAEGREGCRSVRFSSPQDVAGLVMFRATPRDTPAIAEAPHPFLMAELIAQLEGMNLGVGEPKWRRMDVPFSGLEGFGNGTMSGFDAKEIEGDARSEAIMFFFDGPDSHFDLLLLTEPEATAPDAFTTNIAGFRALMQGLNKAKQQ